MLDRHLEEGERHRDETDSCDPHPRVWFQGLAHSCELRPRTPDYASTAERAGDDVVEVSILHVLDEPQVRMELDLYLPAWESIHAGGRIETLD
jgi:hypothetical protein